MSLARAIKLFFRRMVCLNLANPCPFVSGRIMLYRWMGIRIGSDVFIGFGVEFDTNASELRIGGGAWICVGATILPGVTIGAKRHP